MASVRRDCDILCDCRNHRIDAYNITARAANNGNGKNKMESSKDDCEYIATTEENIAEWLEYEAEELSADNFNF